MKRMSDKNRLTIKNISEIENHDFGKWRCSVKENLDVYIFTFVDDHEVISFNLKRIPHHYSREIGAYMYEYRRLCYVSADWFNLKNAISIFRRQLNLK